MWFDVINLFIVLFSCIISCFRGLIRELFGLLGIVATVLLFAKYHDILVVDFSEHFNEQLSELFSAGIVVVLLLILFNVLASWFASIFSNLRFNVIDRFGGLLIGGAKGVLFSYLLFVLLQFFYISAFEESDASKKAGVDDKNTTDAQHYVPKFFEGSESYLMLNMFEEQFMGSFNVYIKAALQDALSKYRQRHAADVPSNGKNSDIKAMKKKTSEDGKK